MSDIGEAAAWRRLRSAAVIGAGTMGAGIASACIGVTPVLVVDPDPAALTAALRRIRRRVYRDVADGVLSSSEARRRLGQLTLCGEWPAGAAPDLVIESVPEDVEVKRCVVRSIERHLPPRCIWASNTSAIRVSEIASCARHPERVIGMHFFHPADQVRLLELAVPPVAEDAAAAARAFGVLLNKCVVQVADAPGFYTTRVLSAYFGAALELMAQGIAPDAIDRAAERFGFNAGPFVLLDRIGIDVAARVAAYLAAKSRRAAAVPSTLAPMVAAGLLGVKGGGGFYSYGRGGSPARRPAVNPAVRDVAGLGVSTRVRPRVIVEFIVGREVEEAMRALHQGVVRSELDADVAAVLGCGFPARTGGPFHYALAHGAPAASATTTSLPRATIASGVEA